MKMNLLRICESDGENVSLKVSLTLTLKRVTTYTEIRVDKNFPAEKDWKRNMKDREKYVHAIRNIESTDESAIKAALDREGLYSKSEIFPLASLQFELTSHCNAACKHCYNNSGAQNNCATDTMSPEKWISFAKYIVAKGGVFECLLSGGEPLLLGEKLFELMDILHNDGTIFLLQTNGFLLTEKIAKRLSNYHYHWLQISIDGISETYHDEFRQKKGSWKNAVDAALAVSKNQIPLKIAHCVTPYNINDIDEMCSLAYSLGASAITIGEICLSGRSSENQDLFLSSREKELLSQKIQENRARYQGHMIVKGTNSVRYGLERQRRSPASAALIRPNGDIRIDGMAPFVIGNILTDDFIEVWKEKILTCWENPKVIETSYPILMNKIEIILSSILLMRTFSYNSC